MLFAAVCSWAAGQQLPAWQPSASGTEAVAAHQPAASRPASPAALRFAQGEEVLRSGDVTAATSLLAEACRLQPDEPPYALALARAYAAVGEEQEAAAALDAALRHRPESLPLWLARIDVAQRQRRYGEALRLVHKAERTAGSAAALHFRAASAYFASGRLLGDTTEARVENGHEGQFAFGKLLVERRAGRDRFLCCRPDSALYEVRQALDGGCDDPAAHLLHARIWARIGRPLVALAIVRGREAQLLETADDATLQALCDLALGAGALEEYLHFARRRAELDELHGDEVMHQAYLAVADHYNRRGDDATCIEFLRRASQLAPRDADLTLRLADAEWQAGRFEDAVGRYTSWLALAANDKERVRVLERLADWHQARDSKR